MDFEVLPVMKVKSSFRRSAFSKVQSITFILSIYFSDKNCLTNKKTNQKNLLTDVNQDDVDLWELKDSDK